MAKTDKDGNWIDARGKAVPEEYVPELDRERDAMVDRLFKKMLKLEEAIAKARIEALCEIDTYLAKLAKANKVKEKWKGNISLDSFDGALRIQRSMDDQIGFNESLQIVKTQIDKWLRDRLEGVDDGLAKVVSQAFNVDKQGRVNSAMIMKLLHLDIKDAKWQKAMDILKESIVVKATRQYVSFAQKETSDAGENWRKLVLNFNAATEG